MRFEHSTFVGQRILVDGNEYIDNIFQNCILVFSAHKPFQMNNNAFHNTTIEFAGNAANTLALIRALYHGGFREPLDRLFEQIRQAPDAPQEKPS